MDFDKLEKLHRYEQLEFLEHHKDVSQSEDSHDPNNLIYIQDLVKKTAVRNENTLLAQLSVQVRLFEDDFVDHSASFEFKTLFGSTFSEDFNINTEYK